MKNSEKYIAMLNQYMDSFEKNLALANMLRKDGERIPYPFGAHAVAMGTRLESVDAESLDKMSPKLFERLYNEIEKNIKDDLRRNITHLQELLSAYSEALALERLKLLEE